MPPRLALRRRRADDDDSGWTLTLADMMTLILCFFVVMVAMAKVDAVRFTTVAGTMAKAMGGREGAAAGHPRPRPTSPS
jgi:chemotaxis protein MotB